MKIVESAFPYHRHSPKSVWSMHNLIYLFKALYDIHYNPIQFMLCK